MYGGIATRLRKLAQLDMHDKAVHAVPDRLTQQNIAERVGSSRDMVSRVFKPLLEGGCVEMRDGHIARW